VKKYLPILLRILLALGIGLFLFFMALMASEGFILRGSTSVRPVKILDVRSDLFAAPAAQQSIVIEGEWSGAGVVVPEITALGGDFLPGFYASPSRYYEDYDLAIVPSSAMSYIVSAGLGLPVSAAEIEARKWDSGIVERFSSGGVLWARPLIWGKLCLCTDRSFAVRVALDTLLPPVETPMMTVSDLIAVFAFLNRKGIYSRAAADLSASPLLLSLVLSAARSREEAQQLISVLGESLALSIGGKTIPERAVRIAFGGKEVSAGYFPAQFPISANGTPVAEAFGIVVLRSGKEATLDGYAKSLAQWLTSRKAGVLGAYMATSKNEEVLLGGVGAESMQFTAGALIAWLKSGITVPRSAFEGGTWK